MMRRKVIQGLSECLKNEQYNGNGCENCPYDSDQASCRERLYKDAIESLILVDKEKYDAYWAGFEKAIERNKNFEY